MQTQSLDGRLNRFFRGEMKLRRFGVCVCTSTLAAILMLTGCDKNPASPSSGGTASIEGYVGGGGLGKIAGTASPTTVIVAEAQADGSLRTVSTSSVQTDASGYYKIDVSADRERNLIVVAAQATTTYKAVVASEVSRGTSVKAPPASDRSTVSASVYQRLVATGRAGAVTMADIDASIDSDIAANVRNDDAATVYLADAISARVQAETDAFSSAGVTLTQAQISTIMQAKVDAAAEFDNSLYGQGENAQGTQAAYSAFVDAMAHVYLDHGLDVDGYSRVQLIALRAMSQWSAQISVDARFRIERNLARVKARVFGQVGLAKFQTLGAAQAQIDAAVSANTALRDGIEIAGSGSDLTAAFSAYHDAVLLGLRTSVSAYASAISIADAQVSGPGGFRSQLQASVIAASTVIQVRQAFLLYFTAVKGVVTSGMVGASDVQINAVASVISCINLYS